MPFNKIPLVDQTTLKFPEPTMEAIREDIIDNGDLVTASNLTATISEILSTSPLVAEAVAGAMSSGGSVHLGDGPPPDFIAGSKVGDVYIDQTNLTIYQMEAGA